MAEPKKRLTSSRSGKRRSHLFKKFVSLSKCSQCNELMYPHRVCPNCGFYNGNDVLKLEQKIKAKEERRKKSQEATKKP